MSKANDTIRHDDPVYVYALKPQKKNVKKPIFKNVDFLKLFIHFVLVSMHPGGQDYILAFLTI